MKSAMLVWFLLPAVLWAGGKDVMIDKAGACFLGKVAVTPEEIGEHFSAHPEDLESRGDLKVLRINCDSGAPTRAILTVIQRGAMAQIASFDLTVDGRTLTVHLPQDAGIAPEDPDNRTPIVAPVLLNLCSAEKPAGHCEPDLRTGGASWEKWKEHAAPLIEGATATSAKVWVGTDSKDAVAVPGEKAIHGIASRAVAAATRAGDREPGIIILRSDPNVAAGTWHAVLAAVQSAGADEIQLAAIP